MEIIDLSTNNLPIFLNYSSFVMYSELTYKVDLKTLQTIRRLAVPTKDGLGKRRIKWIEEQEKMSEIH